MKIFIPGVIIACIAFFPSLLYAIFLPKGAADKKNGTNTFFTALERIGQAGCIIALFVAPDIDRAGAKLNIFFWLMCAALVLQYAVWIRYFLKGRDAAYLYERFLLVPVPMAVFPVLAFAFSALWLKSMFLGAAVAFLAVGHIAVTVFAKRQQKK
ncbi:MAG: hypothetical protein RR235_09630 [Oscillospiraceae bacterium]